MESFKKLLECPVCYEILTPPVETCDNGHLTCQHCRSLLENCPTCRGNFISFKNIIFNQVLESLPEYCEFANYGCEKIVSSSEKAAHAAVCNYKLVSCPNSKCGETKLVYCEIDDHLRKIHGSYGSRCIKFEEESSFRVDLLKGDNFFGLISEVHRFAYFSWRCIIDRKNNTFSCCIQYIGRREYAKKYLYQIYFDQSNHIKFSFGGYCLPYMDTNEEMKANPEVFTFDLNKIFFQGVPNDIKFYVTLRFAE